MSYRAQILYTPYFILCKVITIKVEFYRLFYEISIIDRSTYVIDSLFRINHKKSTFNIHYFKSNF